MATAEAIQRWRSVLLDIEKMGAMPSGQKVRAQLNSPEARAGWQLVNGTFLYGVVEGSLTCLVNDLWSVDAPRDPAVVAVLRPVMDAATQFTPLKPLIEQWDRYTKLVTVARKALEDNEFGEPTADEIIHEMSLSLKTSMLISGMGMRGSMKIIAEEISRRYVSFGATLTLPLRYYDFASKEMVDKPSRTTLSLAAIKSIIDPTHEDAEQLGWFQPPGMKQFAAQVIVDFYTDWEEYYRIQMATAHQCDRYDFQIPYFGDLGKMRHDYVHNRGVCRTSAHCTTLKWFSSGDLMIPSADMYLQLLTDFPRQALSARPSRVETGRSGVRGSASIPVLREFERVARESHGGIGPALDQALADWTARNAPADS